MNDCFKLLLLVTLFQGLFLASVHAESSGSSTHRPPQILKGRVPSDQNYLRFMDWHREHSVLFVVIDGSDRESIKHTLESLVELKRRGVLIGEIFRIGEENADLFTDATQKRPLSREQLVPENIRNASSLKTRELGERIYARYQTVQMVQAHDAEAATELKLSTPQEILDRSILEKFQLEYSPAFIVRYRGTDYVFQGKIDPRQLFTKDGRFRGANENHG